jgi:hypothetical protein
VTFIFLNLAFSALNIMISSPSIYLFFMTIIFYPFICLWFHKLDTVNSATINMGMQVLLFCVTSDMHPEISMFRFLRNIHNDFHSAWTNLHSHQQYTMIYLSTHLKKCLMLAFLMIDNSHWEWIEMKSFLLVHLFICVYIIWAISPLRTPISPFSPTPLLLCRNFSVLFSNFVED